MNSAARGFNGIGPLLIWQKNQQVRLTPRFRLLHFKVKQEPSRVVAQATADLLRPTYFARAPVSCRFNRALRRSAALRWMMPSLAALSSEGIRQRICSA